jgi:hypothetical protein
MGQVLRAGVIAVALAGLVLLGWTLEGMALASLRFARSE